jgi:hypothetical protein
VTTLALADQLRSAVLRRAAPRALIADRHARVLWLGLASISIAFLGVFFFGRPMLRVAPLVLGVPHLLADVRYLVVRRGHHRSPGFWLLIAPPALAMSFGAPAAVGFAAVVGAGVLRRSALITSAGLLLVALGARFGDDAQGFFLNAHNFVALALWWSWRPRPLTLLVIPALALAGWAVLWRLGSLDVEAFAFAQAVHYAVWLRLIPEDDRDRPAPRSFRASWAALRVDFPLWTLAVFAVIAIGLAVWGLFDVHASRGAYLALASFHGYLELGIVARR